MGIPVALDGERHRPEVGAADLELRPGGGQHRLLDRVHQHVEDPGFLVEQRRQNVYFQSVLIMPFPQANPKKSTKTCLPQEKLRKLLNDYNHQ